MKQILLMEDSPEINTMVQQALNSIAQITWAATIEGARQALKKKTFDLALLDVELPDGNGVEFCGEMQRTNPLIPIFFLTSHGNLSEKVLGFSAGADDYITKPFNSLELKARVEAKMMKLDMLLRNSDILRWKEIEINKSSQEVQIFVEGIASQVDLTALEFKLLSFFAKHAQAVISRDNILNEIWGEDVHVYARSVDTHVSKLRKKLGAVSGIIESVHGSGYKFAPTPPQ